MRPKIKYEHSMVKNITFYLGDNLVIWPIGAIIAKLLMETIISWGSPAYNLCIFINNFIIFMKNLRVHQRNCLFNIR